jgi:Holliday junction resolvasome RuvABC endonuclease subunit
VRSLGIDPSTTATGFVVLESADQRPRVLFEDTLIPLHLERLERCSAIAGRMLEILGEFEPERTAIEGYGLNMKHPSSVIPLVELGTVLRYFLRQQRFCYLEPSPGELKKFVFGTGKGSKAQMMLQVFKRWGYEAKDEHRADAYGLATIGLAHAGKLPSPNHAMLEVIGAVRLN